MTTINADMTADQPWVPVADPSALAPGLYRIEDEAIRVRSAEHRTTDVDPEAESAADGRWCERGIEGTTAAVHASGTEVTPVLDAFTTSAASPFATGGGEQTVRLLGPFTVSHDSSGITGNGFSIVELAVGTVVVNVGVEVVTPFSDPASLTIGIGGANYATGAFWNIAQPDTSLATGDSDSAAFAMQLGGVGAADPLISTKVGLGIVKTGPGALVAFTAGAQAAGEVKVYALIAEPAA